MALDAAVWLRQQLSIAIAPALLVAAAVQYNPQWSAAEPLFQGLAPAMLAQVGGFGRRRVYARTCLTLPAPGTGVGLAGYSSTS